ncbi:MAG: DUF4153 domain-containing protein [Candidatus Curtissbacteria bacterium]
MRKTLIASFVFVLLFNLFFYRAIFGISTFLFFAALNALFFFNRLDNKKNLLIGAFFSGASCLFALFFAFRASEINFAVNFLGAVFFSLAALYFYRKEKDYKFNIFEFLATPPFVFAGSAVGLFQNLGKEMNSNKKNKSLLAIIRGAIIAIPVVLVLFFILNSADPIFSRFSQLFFQDIGQRFWVSLVVFAATLFLGLTKITSIFDSEKPVGAREGKLQELLVIVGSVAILFALFILVQVRYLFVQVSEQDLASLGIKSLTYSEYVRKGFVELLIAASIGSLVVVYALRFLRHVAGKKWLQVALGVLVVEVGLLLWSDFQRLVLYQAEHGLTRIRVFGFIFLLWLLVVLVVLFVRVFWKIKRKILFWAIVVSSVVALSVASFVNIDGLVATKFVPTVNDEVDYYYISSLSADAASGWQGLILDAEGKIGELEEKSAISAEDNRQLYWRQKALENLVSKLSFLLNKYGTANQLAAWNQLALTDDAPNAEPRKWQNFNLSEFMAYGKVTADFDFYLNTLNLLKRANVISQKVTDEVRQNTQLDRAVNPPFVK